mgnify:CR=1 FL=1
MPTGINAGVSISPWSVCMMPVRALDLLSSCVISKNIGDSLVYHTSLKKQGLRALLIQPSPRSFFGGFLLGLLVGAAVVFLLGTKKGKRLLKAISEEGIDNISNILDEASKTEDLDEEIEKPKKEFVQKRE